MCFANQTNIFKMSYNCVGQMLTTIHTWHNITAMQLNQRWRLANHLCVAKKSTCQSLSTTPYRATFTYVDGLWGGRVMGWDGAWWFVLHSISPELHACTIFSIALPAESNRERWDGQNVFFCASLRGLSARV